MDGTAGPRRAYLNREQVLRAAVVLADEFGLAAVSMRRLSQQLGVVPMALYKHVADKEELLDGMVAAVIGEFEAGDPALEWRAAVRARLLSARRALVRHPWARPAIESRTRRTPEVLRHMDAVAGLLRAGGLSDDLTHHVMHALGNRIWGFSPELFPEPPRDVPATPEEQAALLREAGERYPNILAIVRVSAGGDPMAPSRGCDEDFEFVFALDVLLDGAERLRAGGWTSDGHAPRPARP
jgi:AcrR family transcriptional regulator